MAGRVRCRRLTPPTATPPPSSGRSGRTWTISTWSAACHRRPSPRTARTCSRSRAEAGTAGAWATGPDTAVRYLASLGAAPRGALRPRLAGTSRRRRTAAIRGFYRFAFGEGLIGVDVAAHIDLPRETRHLPETLSVEEVDRLLGSVGDEATGTRGIRDRALLELLYAAGLRISEALRLDGEDLSFDGGFVRVIGKGDRERLVPVGDVALAWLRRYVDDVRPAWLAHRPRRAASAAARCSSRSAAGGSPASRPGRS